MTSPSSEFPARDVALHSKWMRRLARGLLDDASAADDVVQDAWTRLVGQRVQAGYLAAIVRSLAGRRRRSELRRRRRERGARDEGLPSTAEVAERSEIARKLAQAVEGLEEPYRTTLVLRYYDDLPAAEIARRAGIPASTVRARQKRGLDMLRARLDEGDGGRSSWTAALLPLTQARVEASVALAASLTTFVAMKLALISVLAVCGLALVWTASSLREGAARPAGASGEAGPEPARQVQGEGTSGPEGLAPVPREEVALERPAGTAGSAHLTPSVAGQVRARVVDRAGVPVRGAWLRLRHLPGKSASADDAGQLALGVEPAELERLAELGSSRTVDVELGASGHRTRCLRPALRAGATTLELGDVLLLPGGTLSGRVVDGSGQGVEGALVAFGLPSGTEPGDPRTARRGPEDLDTDPWTGRDPALVTTSGPGGGFRLEGLAAGYGTAWARTATSLWAWSEALGLREGEQISGLELVVGDAPDEVITGRVLDPDGRPLAGLELRFSASAEREGWWTQRSDGRGAFHFVPQDGAAQDIRASSPSWEWEPLWLRGVVPGTHELVIAFERSQWLEVAVLDTAGQSLRNGRVVGLPGSGQAQHPLPRCESALDEFGHARIRRPDAPLRVRVEAPGYRDQIVGPIAPENFPAPLTVVLEPVPALLGQVLRADGRPAAGARVSLHRGADADVGTRAPSEEAQAKRSYLTHQGWPGDRDAFIYELMVEPVARVVADRDGRFRLPLPGADAQAGSEVEAGGEGLGGLGYVQGPPAALATAQPEAPWYVHAAVAGEATITSGPHRFEPTGDVELELRLPRAGSIRGRLVLPEGASPAGWTACASAGLAELAEARVGSDGAFEFLHLHAGGWQVRVFEPGRSHPRSGGKLRTRRVPVADVEVVAGQSAEYELVASPRASAVLVGSVRVDGGSMGPARVLLRSATPQSAISSYETTLDPDGGFELALEPGLSNTLAVVLSRGDALLTIETRLTLFAGHNEWAFDFQTAQIAGTLAAGTFARGRFDAGPTYEVERGDVRIRVSVAPAADGAFGPLTVPAGAGVLRGPSQSLRGPGPTWAELDLSPGETRRIELAPR